MDPLLSLELLLRGAAAGAALLAAAAFMRAASQCLAGCIGAAFAVALSASAILYAQPVQDALGPVCEAVIGPLTLLNAILFWWFAQLLFCDNFRLTAWRVAPLALVLLPVIELLSPEGAMRTGLSLAWHGVVLLIGLHALYIALIPWRDDLIGARRRFRVVMATIIALSIGATGFFGAYNLFQPKPDFLLLLQAFDYFVIAFVVAGWTLTTRPQFFPGAPRASLSDSGGVAAEDGALLSRLKAFMEAGGYAEPGLTVRTLADKLGAQEHRLRKVINQGLGYRNFAAFLNEHRVEAAKQRLADPEQARRQVLQIALDLGYGSIAPFNRAFREATGETPTQYRKTALRAGPGPDWSGPAATH